MTNQDNNQNKQSKPRFSAEDLQRMQNEMTIGHPDYKFAPAEVLIDDLPSGTWNGEEASIQPRHLEQTLQFIQNFEPFARKKLQQWLAMTKPDISKYEQKYMQEAQLDWSALAEDPETVEFWAEDYDRDRIYFHFPTKFLFQEEQALKEFEQEQIEKERKKKEKEEKMRANMQAQQYQQYLKLKKQFEGENHE